MKNSLLQNLLLVVLAIALVSIYGCQSKTTTVTISGNIKVENKCGGLIDSVFIKIKTYHEKEGRNPVITDSFAVVDGFVNFKKDYTVSDDADRGRIVEVTGKNGVAICSSATKTTCAAPKTCKNTSSANNTIVTFDKKMTYDVVCDCK